MMTSELLYETAAATAHRSLLSYILATFPGEYEVRPHHLLLMDRLEALERGDITRLMVFMPPQRGKALAVDTPIPTPSGWKAICDLSAGDLVFDENGQPCTVIASSPIWRDRPVYAVTADAAQERVLADAEHQWVVRLCRKREVYHPKTTRFLAERDAQRRPFIRWSKPLQIPERTLPIPPYVLGLWLGDGCAGHATITAGDDDLETIRRQVEAAGVATSDRSTSNTFGLLGVWPTLCELGLDGNKHVPSQYLWASRDQRLELLQGLIDSDGHVASDGRVEFCSTTKALADAVWHLVASLGARPRLYEGKATLDGADCGTKYRVYFYLPMAARLPRKAQHCREHSRRVGYHIDVLEAGRADTVCIQVDSPSQLFLAGRMMIPTHNSEIFSVRFPAWYHGRNPDKNVMQFSYGADLAYDFSRQVRDQIGGPDWPFPHVQLKPGEEKVQQWALDGYRGRHVAAGVGGAATGKGADLALIDDPIKNDEEAKSPTYRERTLQWYQKVVRTRMSGEGRIGLCLTRWHEDDLAGRLLEDAKDGGEEWEVLELREMAEADDNDPLGREPGEVLWPTRHPPESTEAIRETQPTVWSPLYQQRPQDIIGGMFKRAKMRGRYDPWDEHGNFTVLPEFEMVVITVDSAFSEDVSSSRSAIAVWGATLTHLYVIDAWYEWVGYPDLIDAIKDVYAKWVHLDPLVYIENKASGQSALQTLYAESGIPALEYEPGSASKESRAQVAARYFAANRVLLPGGLVPWRAEWVKEHADFPSGKNDDLVDTTSMAVRVLVDAVMVPGDKADEPETVADEDEEEVVIA